MSSRDGWDEVHRLDALLASERARLEARSERLKEAVERAIAVSRDVDGWPDDSFALGQIELILSAALAAMEEVA